MPTIAEMCDVHYEFESQRGLLDHNTGLFALHRLTEELGEAWAEHDNQDYFRMLQELIDVAAFSYSIMGDLCRKLDISYERLDQMMIETMERAKQKYRVEYFANRSPAEAIEYSRQRWKE